MDQLGSSLDVGTAYTSNDNNHSRANITASFTTYSTTDKYLFELDNILGTQDPSYHLIITLFIGNYF